MTNDEMRELDAWIAENIFGGALALTGETNPLPHYTTDPAAAMEVLKQLHHEGFNVETWSNQGTKIRQYWAALPDRKKFAQAPTLEIALALFAQQLYRKDK